MNYIKDLRTLLLLLLIGALIAYQFNGCEPEPDPGPIIEIDTVYKEVKVEVPKYVPKWRTQIQEVQVAVEGPAKPVDTTAILKDYFAKYKTIDTLRLNYPDSNATFGYGVVTDVISMNQIIERSINWDYKIPVITKTITIRPKSVNQVYVGISSGFNRKNFVDNVAGGLILKTKKDHIYQASIGLGNRGGTIVPFVGGGIYWKIRLKKPKVTDLIR